MFNEREALRLRLEQLNEAEVKVIREYQIGPINSVLLASAIF